MFEPVPAVLPADVAAPPVAVPRWHLHRRMYNWMLSFSHKPGAVWALFWFSFAEASFFPVPPDVLMIPMCLDRRELTWRFAWVATIGSVLGGLAGFGIGVLAHNSAAITNAVEWLFTKPALESASTHLGTIWVITLATIIFHPYKLLTIAAGLLAADHGTIWHSLWVFTVGSVIGRGVRFLFVAGLVYWFGPAVKKKIDRYFNILSIILLLLIVGAFVFIRFIGKHGEGAA